MGRLENRPDDEGILIAHNLVMRCSDPQFLLTAGVISNRLRSLPAGLSLNNSSRPTPDHLTVFASIRKELGMSRHTPPPFLIAFATLMFSCSALAQEAKDVRILEPGKPIERELAGGETHSYLIALDAGQFMQTVVDQRGIDVVVAMYGPDGKKISEVDSPNGTKGPEPMSVVVDVAGNYLLEVRSLEKNAAAGRYEVKVEAIRAGTAQDKEAIRAATAQDKIEHLARALAAAQTEDEMKAVLQEQKELLTKELLDALFRRADRLSRLSNFQQSNKVLRVTQDVAERMGDEIRVGRALANLGWNNELQYNLTEALRYYQQALAIFEAKGEKKRVAQVIYRIGVMYEEQGDYPRAYEYYQQSLTQATALGDTSQIAAANLGLGILHMFWGEYSLAAEYEQKALALAESIGDKRQVNAAIVNLGAIYDSIGDYSKVLQYQQQALTSFESSGAKQDAALMMMAVGHTHLKLGNYSQALLFFQNALKVSEALDLKGLTATILLGIGKYHVSRGDLSLAFESDQKAVTLVEAIGNKHQTVDAMLVMVDLLRLQGNHSRALEYCQKSLALSSEIDDPDRQAWALYDMAQVYNSQKRYSEALDSLDRSIDLSQQTRAIDRLWTDHVEKGRAYKGLNQFARAKEELDESISIIETLRKQSLGDASEQKNFFVDKLSPYHEMVALLAAEDVTGAFTYSERTKGRVLLDVLRSGGIKISKAMTVQEQQQDRLLSHNLISLNSQISAESQSSQSDQKRLAELKAQLEKVRLDYEAFQTGLYAAHPQLKIQRAEAQPIKLHEVAALLPDAKTAALEFVVTEDKTYLFVLTKDGGQSGAPVSVKVYPLAIKQKELSDRTEHFRRQLAKGDLEFQKAAREMYDLLLKPAQSEFQGKTTLVFVPDDALWNLPFQALQPTPGRYLIEDQAIFYAPSLTVLREMIKARRKPSANPMPGSTLLAFGNPAVNKQTAERVQRVLMDEKLEPLPEAERQVAALAKLYGPSQSRVYTGADAREERAKAEAGGFRILDFATHGVLNDSSPMYSHLVLSQAEGNDKEDGLLEAWEMMNLDLHADMVVLSACETARGRTAAGEGVIGMSWALFVAGAPTTVVSQWKVESASTTELMLNFHRNIKIGMQNPKLGMTKAKALQQASIKLLRSDKYSHPFYWAGFVVVGNGF
jgi:CHAT domain-containing protein